MKFRIKLRCGGKKLGINNCPLPLGWVDASKPGQREFNVLNFCPTTNSFLKEVGLRMSFMELW